MSTQIKSLQWRYNERGGISNHQPHDYLFNRLFRNKKAFVINASVPAVVCSIYTLLRKTLKLYLENIAGVFQGNWFSVRGLGLWMNSVSPVWWSTFRFMFIKWQLVCNFARGGGISYRFVVFSHVCLHITKVLPIILYVNCFFPQITSFMQSTIYGHIP